MEIVQFISKCLHTGRNTKVEANQKKQKKGNVGTEKHKAMYVTW